MKGVKTGVEPIEARERRGEGSNPSTGITRLHKPHDTSSKLKIAVKCLLNAQVFA